MKKLRLSNVLFVVVSLLASTQSLFGQASSLSAQRIVFLGDSITYAGGFITSVEAALIASDPERKIELLNLGLPSETVSGLSEPGHANDQFPRPDLHERLQRVLDESKPHLVVACYGMNDGIYYPQSEERFNKFKSGIERLHDHVVAHDAAIIHLTPAFFDALPIQSRLLPAGLSEYRQPFEGYDDVLQDYSTWLLSQREKGWVVFDVHAAMKNAVMQQRISNPQFTFATDGVHPNAEGQAVIARLLANEWNLAMNEKGLVDRKYGESLLQILTQKQNVLKLAWLTKTKHLRPGIASGMTIPEAEAKAKELDLQARDLVKQK